jgi:pimeloyl-ACP methyl ester carboxylesterase
MQAVADRYFRGLLHAEILVLHKPGIDLTTEIHAKDCDSSFIRWDSLSHWANAAKFALQNDRTSHSQLPQILIGASEGAEILPYIAGELANLQAMVLISSSGLNPRVASKLQARRLGAEPLWQLLDYAVASSERGDSIREGRSLQYWRDLWSWEATSYLLNSNVPIIQIWGDEDELVPKEAYEIFARLVESHNDNTQKLGRICSRCLNGYNHGLQSSERDGVQWLWAQIERWARTQNLSPCAFIDDNTQFHLKNSGLSP